MNLALQPGQSRLAWPYVALVLLAMLLAGTLTVRPATAQGSVTIVVTPAFEGNYAPARWLPLSIVLRNDGPPTTALVAAALPNVGTRNTQLVELAGSSETRLTLYVAMDRQARSVRVTAEQGSQVVAEQQVELRPREGERLLGLVSAQPLELGLPRRQDLASLPFLAFPIDPVALPDRLAGLSSLSLLLLSDAPTASLRPEQLNALLAWVRGGGHLIIGGGPTAAATVAGLPSELRVAELGASTTLDPTPLGVYADAPAPAQLDGIGLTPLPGATGFGSAAAPLWAAYDLGNGRVTQLAFDPALRVMREWPGAPTLWDKLLRPVRIYTAGFGSDTTPDLLREQVLASALGYLPAINLPNAGPLFLALAVYTILIGPGAALLLRRLDRQELGWLVLPLLAAGFFAFGLAIALTGQADQRIVSQVSLIEQISADSARARTVVGILSPRSEQFDLALPQQALVRPLPPGSSTFAAVGAATGQLAQETSQISLDVERWALQGVLAEEIVALPILDAQIVLRDSAIAVVVRNTTDQNLRDVVVAYAGQVISVGDLAPGAVGQANWPPSPPENAERQPNSTPLSVLVLGEELAEGRGAGGQIDRRLLIREALINAAVGRGSQAEDPDPIVLAWIERSPLSLTVTATGAAQQQISLLVSQPQLRGSGRVFVPPGWMRLDTAATGLTACSGPLGKGISAAPAPLTMTLGLPPDLATIRAESLTIDLQSERTWPNAGVRTELYDWPNQRWVEVDFDGPGSLIISQAEPFVRGGQAQIRLSGRIEEAGCIFVETRLRGELPTAP